MPTPLVTRILIAYDHSLVRSGLRQTKEEAPLSTRSEQRGTSRARRPIFASVGRRRRSLAAISILSLTAVALVAVLVVILANA